MSFRRSETGSTTAIPFAGVCRNTAYTVTRSWSAIKRLFHMKKYAIGCFAFLRKTAFFRANDKNKGKTKRRKKNVNIVNRCCGRLLCRYVLGVCPGDYRNRTRAHHQTSVPQPLCGYLCRRNVPCRRKPLGSHQQSVYYNGESIRRQRRNFDLPRYPRYFCGLNGQNGREQSVRRMGFGENQNKTRRGTCDHLPAIRTAPRSHAQDMRRGCCSSAGPAPG